MVLELNHSSSNVNQLEVPSLKKMIATYIAQNLSIFCKIQVISSKGLRCEDDKSSPCMSQGILIPLDCKIFSRKVHYINSRGNRSTRVAQRVPRELYVPFTSRYIAIPSDLILYIERMGERCNGCLRYKQASRPYDLITNRFKSIMYKGVHICDQCRRMICNSGGKVDVKAEYFNYNDTYRARDVIVEPTSLRFDIEDRVPVMHISQRKSSRIRDISTQ